MKLPRFPFGKAKTVSFDEFRDIVRLAVRRQVSGAKLEQRDDGFMITRDGKATTCNLRGLYLDYTRNPGNREALIQQWIDTLTMEVPEHSWMDAQFTLRPTLKPATYLANAHRQMQKNTPPDSLPYAPFAGEISVIIMRDLPGQAVAVTQYTLDQWGVSFAEALRQSINNMNMCSFPPVDQALMAGGTTRGGTQEEVGLVFEGDHLTATWLIIERFRDYITQRLNGDYVVFVPTRSRLIAIRADEAGLIAQMSASNRNLNNQTHALTSQAYHVSGAMTGGIVTVMQPGLQGGAGAPEQLDPNSVFAKGGQNREVTPGSGTPAPAYQKPRPVDLSTWGGLSEPTDTGRS